MLILLSNLPMDELGVQSRGAIQHARLVVLAAHKDLSSAHAAIARFALARVIVLLEKHVEASFRSIDDYK